MMGVFDYITCEYPLPDGLDASGVQFQTKDTDAQYLEPYKITKDGELWHETGEYEETPKAERPYPDAPDDSISAFVGCMRKINKLWERVDFRGELNFYSDVNGKWHEYSALFDNGKLLNIRTGDEA